MVKSTGEVPRTRSLAPRSTLDTTVFPVAVSDRTAGSNCLTPQRNSGAGTAAKAALAATIAGWLARLRRWCNSAPIARHRSANGSCGCSPTPTLPKWLWARRGPALAIGTSAPSCVVCSPSSSRCPDRAPATAASTLTVTVGPGRRRRSHSTVRRYRRPSGRVLLRNAGRDFPCGGTSPAAVSRTSPRCALAAAAARCTQEHSGCPVTSPDEIGASRPNNQAASAAERWPSPRACDICSTATAPVAVPGPRSSVTAGKTCRRHGATRASSWSSPRSAIAARHADHDASAGRCTVKRSASIAHGCHCGYLQNPASATRTASAAQPPARLRIACRAGPGSVSSPSNA